MIEIINLVYLLIRFCYLLNFVLNFKFSLGISSFFFIKTWLQAEHERKKNGFH